ncbi:SDR family NAD(P)-dependent oxidoreductase [Acidovorax sp. JHL-9]|uniref:SDR family NAD(P)-dependent oxidoreductase n=1 Tax=Acidovorax sp. JHL-9 TaxID=1276756 RepID=UPI00040ABE89|nr:SDR family oxidoreductase [Acidovorax sp. JHL-9]
MNRSQDIVSVVTGGASGIGLACAQALAARGDRVVVLDLPATRATVSAMAFVECDVAQQDSVHQALQRIEAEHGLVSVLVNSAGVIQPRLPPEDLDMATWDRVMDIDLRGTYLTCAAFGAVMARRGHGAVVNIASITGSRSVPLHAYAPAKAAVISLTQCLAGEWGRSGVRVNSVSPGYTLTPALQRAIDVGDRDPSDLTRATALGRMVRTEEVAAAVAFLTSDASSGITGVDLPVDAGWLAGTPWQTYGGVPGARARDNKTRLV